MHIFDTPAPVRAVLDLGLGDVWMIAGEYTRTSVGVHPADPDDPRDVTTAERTRVEYGDGRLLVLSPRPSGSFGTGGTVTVMIELPAGSSLLGRATAADVRCEGRLGECHLTSDTGQLRLERTGALCLTADFGDVTVERAVGAVEATVHSGVLRMGEVEGPAVVNKTTGAAWIGEVTGDLRVRSARGSVSVGRAHAGVEARTCRGDIRIDEVLRGPVAVNTTAGEVELGIAGRAVTRLDAVSEDGRVYRSLDTFQAPDTRSAGSVADTVRVRARTVSGDIVVRRASVS